MKVYFEKRGFNVMRAAGSHGPADLVALSTSPGTFHRIIQCKAENKPHRKEKRALARMASKHYFFIPAWAEPDGSLQRVKVTEF